MSWLFQPLTPASADLLSGDTTGYIRVWMGSSWDLKPVYWYNGSSWELKPLKYWDGSDWSVSA